MTTARDFRRAHLLALLDQYGGLAALNRRLGRSDRDATLGQIAHGYADSKTGAPRQMGDRLARAIEQSLGLPAGYMDMPLAPTSGNERAPVLTEQERALIDTFSRLTTEQQRAALETLTQQRTDNERVLYELAGRAPGR